MKSLMSLVVSLVTDVASRCDVDATHDIETIVRRTEQQGVSFLTITLASFRSDFEQALGSGRVELSHFRAFQHKKGGLPRFLGGFLSQVFGEGALILDEPSSNAIQAIRQITGFANKVLLDTSVARNKAAITKFKECETDLMVWEDTILPDLDLSLFDTFTTILFGQMFSNLDQKVWDGGLLPKHGSGATADGIRGNAKYRRSYWHSRLEPYFSLLEMGFPNNGWYQELPVMKFVEPAQERPVKIDLVPKTLKTPRIIAVEPSVMQYCQQALLIAIVEEIEESPLLTSMIGWKSALPNQQGALQGSLDGYLATLDLSEASDRVSNALVLRMLKNHPHLSGAVQACRSTRAKLPDEFGGETIELRKFASMGSALCFPFESMTFMVLILMGLQSANQHLKPRELLKEFSGSVRTFGDDIIVPSQFALPVIDQLELFALKVNHGKSFWTGKFRESCGKEYFNGDDVTYVKLRRLPPTDRRSADSLISFVELRNHFYKYGYWQTVRHLDKEIEKLIPFPAASDECSALVKHTFLPISEEGLGGPLQRPLITAARVKYTLPADELDGYGALMKFFLPKARAYKEEILYGEDPCTDKNHLLRAGRPKASRIKIERTYSKR